MTDPIITNSSLFRSIVQATRDSVSNLANSIGNETEVEIAAITLQAIRVLLQFHPTQNARQAYVEVVELLLAGKKINLTPEQLIARKNLRVSQDPPKHDPMNEVLDAILEYGKWVMENESEEGKQKGDFNNRSVDT